jgi:tripartite-type tricarboxylate transporter receptor subunit TctC
MKQTKFLGAFLAMALGLGAAPAIAQDFPNKPIKLIVGYAPGGSNDILARLVGQKMSEQIGQPVLIENKPGADARIASEFVAKSAPDGYTLLIGASGAMTLNPALFAPLNYDPVKDFVPITLLGAAPLVVVTHPSHTAKNLKDLIGQAKAKPGSMFYSSGAPPMFVAAEHFKKLVGIEMTHVPFKGSGPSIAAVMANEVPVGMVELPSALPQLRAGRITALAVTDSKRSTYLPDVPTVKEALGIEFDGGIWVGLYAPAGTPQPIIDRLYAEVARAVKSDSVKERMTTLSYDISGAGMPPAEFDKYFKERLARWTKVIKDNNLTVKR